MNDRDIQLLWLYVAEVWSTFNIPTEPELVAIKTQAWQDQLGDLEQRQVHAALAALGAHEFVPPLGKIREKALALVRQQNGHTEAPGIDEAWRTAINTFGRGDGIHPAVMAAIRSIGENELRYCENQVALRAHFFRAYEACKERYDREVNLPAPAVLTFIGLGAAIKRVDDVLGIGPGGA